MRKFGFTLAEVLVTLGIISVISAMTIPSISAKANNKAFAAKLSTTITTLETAFSNMMVDEGVADFFEIEEYKDKISKYIKITKLEDGDFGENYKEDFTKNNFGKTIDGEVGLTGSDYKSRGMPLLLKNNALVQIADTKITIDVNGDLKPNVYGRDLFLFDISSEGKLYAYGSRALVDLNKDNPSWDRAEHWSTSSNKLYACNDTKKALGCAGRLVENNFVVDF